MVGLIDLRDEVNRYDEHYYETAGMEVEERLPRIVGWGLALTIGAGCWAIVYYGIKFFWF